MVRGTATRTQFAVHRRHRSRLTRIRQTPLQFPEISVNVRRALLQTFPYAV